MTHTDADRQTLMQTQTHTDADADTHADADTQPHEFSLDVTVIPFERRKLHFSSGCECVGGV